MTKNVCGCIRFYDEENGEVVSYFGGLVVVDTSGEALFEAVVRLLEKNKIEQAT